MIRQAFLTLALLAAFASVAGAQQGGKTPEASRANETNSGSTLEITSPLGRTGLATRVRIVARITLADGSTLSPVEFFVDGTRVGTVEQGPPYVVEWLDENPFERREITVQASDSAGLALKDTVVLPPFEVVEKSEITGVLVETSVFDKAGRFVTDLPTASFAVTEDDEDQTIDLIARENVESDMVILVDNSQSMARRMDYVRRVAERLAAGLRPKDRAIVAPFNNHVGTITGPTADMETLTQAIGSMRAGGGTALLDALLESTKLLGSSTGRRAIVLITDGYDENSTAKAEDVLRAVQESQVTVYALAIGGVAGISMRGETTLRGLAQQSGGRVFFPARDAEIVSASEVIATDTHNRFLITYTPKNQAHDGSWRKVAVRVPEGFTVRTRAGYFAPEPPPIRPAIEFTVLNDARGYVDVTAADVDVYEDGIAQKVDTFQEAVDPVSIVMALDTSGSMRRVVDLVKATAIDFVQAVRPEDSLALITFADRPKFEHVLATERQWTVDAIQKYTAVGGTALYDALWNSLQTLKGVKGRRSVVVLTDGKDENNAGTAAGSTHAISEVLTLLREVGATIYCVALGTNLDADVLESLAMQSGGQAYFASDASGLDEQFRGVIEDLRRRYVLSYSSTNRNADGGWRKVEIKPHGDGQTVKSAGGYFAPAE